MTKLAEGYKPSEDEEYMNDKQLQYFKEKLIKWRENLIRDAQSAMEQLREINLNEPDAIDQASAEFETAAMLRAKGRNQNLISKIEYALKCIEDKTYGYCEETGEPIGLARLEARPVATLCIEAQERCERHERTHIEADGWGACLNF